MATPLLFSPITLRDTEFRNRLWIPPMCQYQATDGVASSWHLVHYGALARGGAGLVIIEATGVVPEGRISPACLGLWNDEQAEALRPIVQVAHDAGTKIAIQIGHAGRKASTPESFPGAPAGSLPIDDRGWETVGPTDEPFTGLRAPKALTVPEIEALVHRFSEAADRAVRVGFDAIEIHAAHGYLLSEFLSPLVNTRTDAYGGNLQGRAKFLRDIVRRIRGNHPDLPILVRISASDWRDDGMTPEMSRDLAALLQSDGVDFIDVSSASNVLESPVKVGPSYQTPFAAVVREAGLPVGAVGMILSAYQAEATLVTGQADVVFIGREALRNPHTPLAWAAELRADNLETFVPDSYHRAWAGQKR